MVLTLGPDASVQKVADVLLKNRVSSVPVTGEHHELLCILTEVTS
jgi:hypothetical protein